MFLKFYVMQHSGHENIDSLNNYENQQTKTHRLYHKYNRDGPNIKL